MKRLLLILFILIFSGLAAAAVWWQTSYRSVDLASPFAVLEEKEVKKVKPLVKYQFEKLKERLPEASEIVLERVLGKEEGFNSHLFSYTSNDRKITGLFNMPKSGNLEASDSAKPPFPVVVMIRGYVDQETYQTGVGTSRAGEVFASNGYITLAPDFLGYGESDMPPDNVWEERFLRPISVLDLIASVSSIPEADPKHIFLWGHSNGGLVALSVLELSGQSYPTTLWAPVSQFFPYDVLYYTNEFDDGGKALRASLAQFEEDYDTNLYSFDNYLDWIKAPIQLHQGTSDKYIPLLWSNSLVERLKKLDIDIDYYTYTGADHNMNGAWNKVVIQDLDFFNSQL